MTDKLKPCMCGSTDLEILHSATYFVWCQKCFANGSPRISREEAISFWNIRPIEGALLEACEEAIKLLGVNGYPDLAAIAAVLRLALAKARGEA